ncbi:MAG: DUF4339 domain-containing protein [Prevotella sp.]|nr:DUF4339 domain-containing protein [Prevotella sp.]
MNYYIMEDRIKRGPFTLEELKRRGLTPDTLVQPYGSIDWTTASQVPELSDLFGMRFQQAQPQAEQTVQQSLTEAYQQAQAQSQQPQQPANGGFTMMPKDYKTPSILMICFGVLACCCCGMNPIFLLFGILAMVAGNKVMPYYASGNVDKARLQSEKAKKMLLWGVIGGIIWIVIYYVAYYLLLRSNPEMMEQMMAPYKDILKNIQ